MNTHPAINANNSALDKLALVHKSKIIWVPKFHCELNPIEGKGVKYEELVFFLFIKKFN